LVAQDAEKQLKYLRQVNASNRQKLIKMELEFELSEKDPNVFGISNATCVREHFPYGPSTLAHPSSERKAFLSPIVLKDLLRPPPLLQQGGKTASRNLDDPLDYHIRKERGESSCDRLTIPHRAPLETGSLSPPCKQDGRMMIPPLG
jgi:hypothetical protein